MTAGELRQLRQEHAVPRLGRILEATIAVALCGLSLLVFKIASTFSALSEQALALVGVKSLVRKAPRLAAFAGLGVALFAAFPATAKLLLATGGWPVRDGVLVAGLVLLVTGAPLALAAASRLKMARNQISDPIEAWFAPRMIHAADAVWPVVMLNVSLLVLPAVVALAVPGAFGVRTLAVYVAALWVTWQPATDFEHADSHYHFFRRHRADQPFERGVFRILDFYLTYVFTLASSRVPHWYEVQHVIIHHAEDNGLDDTQSTLPYDRAGFVDFARCSNRFAVSGLLSIDVFKYLARNRRRKAIRCLATGMLLFYGMIGGLLLIDWRLAATILAARYVSGIVSSMGFFQEHGIIDVDNPDNIYRNSLHYIAPDNTHGSRGEDFHIAHHLRPGRHWAEYESQVVADAQRYAEERAVGFLDGPGHIDAYYRLLWRRDFAGLARYFIVFGQPDISVEELAALLRARTSPLGARAPSAPEPFDILLGRGASYLLG